MRKVLFSLVALVALVVWSAGCGEENPTENNSWSDSWGDNTVNQDMRPYFPLKIGNEWEFSALLDGITNYGYTMMVKKEVTLDNKHYLKLVSKSESGDERDEGFYGFFTYKGNQVIRRCNITYDDSSPYIDPSRIVGREAITVPAGTFLDCIKVQGGPPDDPVYAWYAKNIGPVKRDYGMILVSTDRGVAEKHLVEVLVRYSLK